MTQAPRHPKGQPGQPQGVAFVGLLSDVMLWLAVVFMVGGLWYAVGLTPSHQQQRITLSFEDANEMIRGSTVRMSGVDVGYVDAIAMRPDHVEVTIKTAPGFTVPPGSRATIKFTGLVGSKSIEITPPDGPIFVMPNHKSPPHHWITVEEPIRLKDAIDYNIEIAEALQRGAEHFSDFFGKRKPVEELEYNLSRSKIITDRWVGGVTSAAKGSQRMTTRYAQVRLKALKMLASIDSAVAQVAEITGRKMFKPSTGVVVTYVDDLFREASGWIHRFSNKDGFAVAQQKVDDFDRRMMEPLAKIQRWGDAAQAGKLESALDKADQRLLVVQHYFGLHPDGRFPAVRRAIQGVNRFFVRWTQRLP